MKDYKNVLLVNHPLIQHKVAILRDVKTSMKEFRELIEEITMLMTYESMRNVQTIPVKVETPLGVTTQYKVTENSIVIVPILRAGLGMVNGIHKLFPSARVGHVGLYRDEETLSCHEYYCKLPHGIQEKTVYVLDVMLATGGSANDAISMLKEKGCKDIKFMAIVSSPEGLQRLAEAHPDVQIFISTLDNGLNERGYIVPGLGDAGDRLFGTK